MTEYYSAILIGLLGSFHCVGMCGPLVVTLHGGLSGWKGIFGRLVYQAGRVFTYIILGIIFGLMGSTFALAGLQQWLSIGVGVFVILTVLLPASGVSKFLSGKFLSFFSSRLRTLFKSKNYPSFLMAGAINGLLPCGLVYIAIAGAMATGGYLSGGVFMFAFGAGTIPALLLVSMAGEVLGNRMRNRINKVIPYMIIMLGLLFILRGLNLGIPYISPQITENQEISHSRSCH